MPTSSSLGERGWPSSFTDMHIPYHLFTLSLTRKRLAALFLILFLVLNTSSPISKQNFIGTPDTLRRVGSHEESALVTQNGKTIGQRIENYAVNNLIIVTICNKGMATEWLQQWYVSAQRASIRNTIVIATDTEAFEWIRERIGDRVIDATDFVPLIQAERWNKIKKEDKIQNAAYNWRSGGYESIVTQRATILKKILETTNLNVLYSDTDIHWMLNPSQILKKYMIHNVCLQREKGDELGDYNCSGVMLFLNSEVTLKFLAAWEQYIKKRMLQKGFFTDQEEVNHLLSDLQKHKNGHAINDIYFSNFSACTLDWDEFPSGINFFFQRERGKGKRDKTCSSKMCRTTVWSPVRNLLRRGVPNSTVLVHHNFAKSNKIKIQRAKDNGLWLDLSHEDWFD